MEIQVFHVQGSAAERLDHRIEAVQIRTLRLNDINVLQRAGLLCLRGPR